MEETINVNDYKLYVMKIANRYIVDNTTRKDLIQEGLIGVFNASKMYDPSKGISFISYATYHIIKQMNLYIHNNYRTIRLPIHIRKELKKYNTLNPDTADLKDFPKFFRDFINEGNNKPISSLNELVGEDSSTELAETIPDTPPEDPSDEIKEMLRGLEKIKPKYKNVLIKYYGLYDTEPLTLQQIADEEGKTKELIRQRINYAEKAIRKHITQ